MLKKIFNIKILLLLCILPLFIIFFSCILSTELPKTNKLKEKDTKIDTISTPTINASSQASSVNSQNFQLPIKLFPPRINQFLPLKGTGGVIVTIVGANFDPNIKNNTVKFNDVLAQVNSVTYNTLTVTVPSDVQTGLITVATPAGGAQSPEVFTLIKPPRIDGFTPTFGICTTEVTINGKDFSEDPSKIAVKFNGLTGAVQQTGSTRIIVKVPCGNFVGPITVTTEGGSVSSTTRFTSSTNLTSGLQPTQSILPTITSVVPNQGSVNTIVTIKGTNFGSEISQNEVRFNNVKAEILMTSDVMLKVKVPQGALTGLIKIISPGGEITGFDDFIIPTSSPIITGFSPISGKSGNTITIFGSNFVNNIKDNIVRFDTEVAEIVSAAGTILVVKIPRSAKSGIINVITPLGTGSSTNEFIIIPSENATPEPYSSPLPPVNPSGVETPIPTPTPTPMPSTTLIPTPSATLPPGTLGGFNIITNKLATKRYGHTTLQRGSTVYLFGSSENINGNYYCVEKAPVSGNDLGDFSSFNNNMQVARINAFAMNIGSYIYIIGGQNMGNTVLSNIEYSYYSCYQNCCYFWCNPWTCCGSTCCASDIAWYFNNYSNLLIPRSGHAFVEDGTYIYISGGKDNSGNTLTSFEKTYPSGSSLGGFSPVFNTLGTPINLLIPRSEHTMVKIGNYIYVFGGRDKNGNALDSIERASFQGSGRVSIFSLWYGKMKQARFDHTTAILGNYVYHFGGTLMGYPGINNIERAPIYPNGDIGEFTSYQNSLVVSRAGHSQLILGNYIYLIGGQTADGTLTDTIERAMWN